VCGGRGEVREEQMMWVVVVYVGEYIKKRKGRER
jgi:hypothetical protein